MKESRERKRIKEELEKTEKEVSALREQEQHAQEVVDSAEVDRDNATNDLCRAITKRDLLLLLLSGPEPTPPTTAAATPRKRKVKPETISADPTPASPATSAAPSVTPTSPASKRKPKSDDSAPLADGTTVSVVCDNCIKIVQAKIVGGAPYCPICEGKIRNGNESLDAPRIR